MPRLAVFAAGSNSHGQLGTGNDDDAHTFRQCPLEYTYDSDKGDPEIKIAAGANHTLLLVSEGDRQTLYTAGSSQRGQLGGIHHDTHHLFKLCYLDTMLFTLPENDLLILEDCSPAVDWKVVDIAAGWETSFILVSSKSIPASTLLLTMGSNDFNQLGHSSYDRDRPHIHPSSVENRFRSIVSGPRHCVATTAEGQLMGWGTARHGQLDFEKISSALGETLMSASLGNQHTCIVDSRSEGIYCLGKTAATVKAYTTWSSTFLLSESETTQELLSFGNNASGQLGRSETNFAGIGQIDFKTASPHKIISLAAGSEHVLALLETAGEQQVWGWGWNEHGNLGSGDYSLEDIRAPKMLWSSSRDGRRVHSIHAGNGTSWIVTVEEETKS